MADLTTVTPELKYGIIEGPGYLFRDYDITTGVGTPLGATRGGTSFNPNISTRQVEVDGVIEPIKCFNRLAPGPGPTMTVRLIEINRKTLLTGIPGAVETANGGITIGAITDDAYIDNIALVCTTSDPNKRLFVVMLYNALATAVSDMSANPNDEVIMEVTFTGHRDVSDPTKPAFEIIPVPDAVEP